MHRPPTGSGRRSVPRRFPSKEGLPRAGGPSPFLRSRRCVVNRHSRKRLIRELEAYLAFWAIAR